MAQGRRNSEYHEREIRAAVRYITAREAEIKAIREDIKALKASGKSFTRAAREGEI